MRPINSIKKCNGIGSVNSSKNKLNGKKTDFLRKCQTQPQLH